MAHNFIAKEMKGDTNQLSHDSLNQKEAEACLSHYIFVWVAFK